MRNRLVIQKFNCFPSCLGYYIIMFRWLVLENKKFMCHDKNVICCVSYEKKKLYVYTSVEFFVIKFNKNLIENEIKLNEIKFIETNFLLSFINYKYVPIIKILLI